MKEKSIDLLDAFPYVRHVSLVDSAKDKCFTPWRVLYDFEIIFVLEGELLVREKGKEEYVLKKNDFHIMKPNVWHTRYLQEGGACRYYNAHFEFLSKNSEPAPFIDVNKLYINPILEDKKIIQVDKALSQRSYCVLSNVEMPRKIHVNSAQPIVSCFEKMAANFGTVNIFAEYQLRGIFSYLLGLVLKEMQEKDFKYSIDSVIEKFKSECTHSTKKINVEEFSNQHGYSYVYFRNKFKERTGESPSSYAQRVRLLLALRYLESGYYNVSEIAEMIGFENVYHFSAAFKKQFGEAPSNFLRRAKKE
ncbi:MAG: helix-turn-helix transcriptional regulator [Clostridia bacterium]|nr:helix-turn-helix transcriptional regulator [Clostridia bacterium]